MENLLNKSIYNFKKSLFKRLGLLVVVFTITLTSVLLYQFEFNFTTKDTIIDTHEYYFYSEMVGNWGVPPDTLEVEEELDNLKMWGGIFKRNEYDICGICGGGILEAAKQLVEMAESAQNHILSETDDWFDGVSVKRNMKELKGLTGQFKKTAVEANATNQRLSALYEDMGNILNRYYDIDEGLDPVGKEDDDVDNDGDSDDSDAYLKKRRKAVTKAIKKEDRVPQEKNGKKLVGWRFAGKTYKKKSEAPVADPRPVYK